MKLGRCDVARSRNSRLLSARSLKGEEKPLTVHDP